VLNLRQIQNWLEKELLIGKIIPLLLPTFLWRKLMKLLTHLMNIIKLPKFQKVLLVLLISLILALFSINSFGKAITVYVIDTGTDLSHEEIRSHVNMKYWNNDQNYEDFHGHGTHIAGIILKDTCKEVELYSCKYYDLSNISNNPIECFKKALIKHYDVINFSGGGKGYSQEEYDVIKAIKSIIIVAAGNENEDISIWHYYPASYELPNVITVGNLDGKIKAQSSSFGLKNMVWEQGTSIFSTFPGGRYGIMTGSSQATANHTNRILKKMCEENTKLK
jgi:major intracellular serine protease